MEKTSSRYDFNVLKKEALPSFVPSTAPRTSWLPSSFSVIVTNGHIFRLHVPVTVQADPIHMYIQYHPPCGGRFFHTPQCGYTPTCPS